MSNEPRPGDKLLVGVIGSSDQRYYWQDDPKGNDAALSWLGCNGNGFKHVFKVTIDAVTELQVVPPVPARLLPKPAKSFPG